MRLSIDCYLLVPTCAKAISYTKTFYAVKKRDQSLFEDCLNREVSGLPETYTTTLRTFKSFATDPKCASLQLFKWTIGMFKQPHQSIKTQCVRLSQLYNFKLRIMIRHGKTFLTNKQNRKRVSSFCSVQIILRFLYQHHLTKSLYTTLSFWC